MTPATFSVRSDIRSFVHWLAEHMVTDLYRTRIRALPTEEWMLVPFLSDPVEQTDSHKAVDGHVLAIKLPLCQCCGTSLVDKDKQLQSQVVIGFRWIQKPNRLQVKAQCYVDLARVVFLAMLHDIYERYPESRRAITGALKRVEK